MKRVLTSIVILAIAFLAGFVTWVTNGVEEKLSAHHLEWADQTVHVSGLVWSNVTGPGLQVQRLTVHPGWPINVHLSGATIDPSTLAPTPKPLPVGEENTPSTPTRQIPFVVRVDDLNVAWNTQTIFENLSGELYPTIRLDNPTNSIEANWNPAQPKHLHGTAKTQLSNEMVSADISIDFNVGDFIQLDAETSNLVVQHPFISSNALPAMPVSTRLVWKPSSEEVALDGKLGNIDWSGIGTTNLQTHDVLFRVPMTPLQSVVELFGEQIPEAKDAEIDGTIGMAATIKGPPWEWSFEPAAKHLSVRGALPPQFGGERVRWTRNGISLQTGPGMKGWVSLADAGWFPEAAIAAEDIRFRTHPGFDLVAIQEALDASMDEERMRGGSTITQQLAKNLFLDGQRTLLRKLRELLLALNMEGRMSKDSILALYLNVVEFGPGIHGIGSASEAWFIKNADQLTPREAAFLTSILPAPHMWHREISKTNRPPIKRVNEVLNRMRIRGTLSVSQHRWSIQERLRVVPP